MSRFNHYITPRYLGVISNLITESELLKKININYTNKNKHLLWLTFKTEEGKILLISNECLDTSVSKNFLYNINDNPIEITIGRNKYLCRLPVNNEWNDLIINSTPYINDVLVLNKYTICASSEYNNFIGLRGYNDIYELKMDIDNVLCLSEIGFRPVLEVI